MTADDQKSLAQNWFEELQDRLFRAFEKLETEADASIYGEPAEPATFETKRWERSDTPDVDMGGGRMGMLRGRVFEKTGIHTSTVYGEFSEEFRHQVPGAAEDPRFWASGISLIAHPRNPHVPAAHMNTRMIATTKVWFGGGGDLNPMMDRYRTASHDDTAEFLSAMQQPCDAADPSYFDRFRKWCDEYFYLPHREEHRGVGGIFYDRLDTGAWDQDFKFTKDVGTSFLEAYPTIVRKRLNMPWTEDDRKEQAFRRGRYAEFNLLYDRGTTFGLKTGGNVESILSSLPPMATWA